MSAVLLGERNARKVVEEDSNAHGVQGGGSLIEGLRQTPLQHLQLRSDEIPTQILGAALATGKRSAASMPSSSSTSRARPIATSSSAKIARHTPCSTTMIEEPGGGGDGPRCLNPR